MTTAGPADFAALGITVPPEARGEVSHHLPPVFTQPAQTS